MPKNLYRDARWHEFRQQCMERVNYRCERCDRGGVLQVHHPEYEAGHAPWEYDPRFCEVLCRGCHAAEHGIILPREGWVIVHSDLDDGEPSDPISCANCGTEIKWHFTIYHPEWGEAVVGSECAENLSLGPELTELKSYYRRRNTFVHSPRWKPCSSGSWRNYEDHYALVYRRGSQFGLKIDDRFGKELYPTEIDARLRAFKVIDQRRRRESEKVATGVQAFASGISWMECDSTP